MTRRKKLKKAKKSDKLSTKQAIIVAATLGIPTLIIIAYNIALVMDQKPVAELPHLAAQVYLYNQDQRCIDIDVRRVVKHDDVNEIINDLIYELSIGPTIVALQPTLNERTQVIKSHIDEGRVLHLTLNKFYKKPPMGLIISQHVRQACLVNTMIKSLPQDITGVIITVKGDPGEKSSPGKAPLVFADDLGCR
jgi:hypothetical protein